MIILNSIPSRPWRQTFFENPQTDRGICTVRNWGFPAPLYSKYRGVGYTNALEFLISAPPVSSRWHTLGLIMNLLIVVGGVGLLMFIRLPGLPGEGQEDIAIIRDSEREDDSNLL